MAYECVVSLAYLCNLVGLLHVPDSSSRVCSLPGFGIWGLGAALSEKRSSYIVI
jgi:hypothetical protein